MLVKIIGNEHRSCDNRKRIDLKVLIEMDSVWVDN